MARSKVGRKIVWVGRMTDRAGQKQAFIDQAGWHDSAQTLIAGDASNRSYTRLTKDDGATAILMDAPPEKGEDVAPFVQIAQHLTDHALSAPLIYDHDTAAGFLLIEDLGDDLFARLMTEDPTSQIPLYTAAVDSLIALHAAPNPPLDPCDVDWLISMTDTVFDWYAPGDATAHMAAFETLFRPIATRLDQSSNVVILRDFHAENLLWLPDRKGVARVGLLDFQDALLGHPAYDLVSILQDARRDVDPKIERRMIDHYLSQTGTQRDSFEHAYAALGAQRNLRILGIFARLCLRDSKAHYVDMIPRVWDYVLRNLGHPALRELDAFIRDTLPDPTPDFLEHLKNRCATHQNP